MSEITKVVDWISGIASGSVKDSGASGMIVGLSGGLDSAVVLALCVQAVGKSSVIGVSMPCFSSPDDKADARLVANKFGIDFRVVNLDTAYTAFTSLMHTGTNMARANLKARLRMSAIYFIDNTYTSIVAGTCNKSEIKTGYFTKYGDGGSDFEPIGDFYKREVKEMAIELGIPEKIVNRVPSAGLCEGQTDEKEMGVTYDDVENVIECIENGKAIAVSEEKYNRIKSLMEGAMHKINPIPVYKR